MGRCTPYQKAKQARVAEAQAKASEAPRRERVRQNSNFSHSIDLLTGGERRLVWSVKVPRSGIIKNPKISTGPCSGALQLDVEFNGVVTLKLTVTEKLEMPKGPFLVKRGDTIAFYAYGDGEAKEVAISIIVQEQ